MIKSLQFRYTLLRGLLVGAALVLTGCDFGAVQKATDSMGVIVQLDSIETTLSAQILDAATGKLVEAPVTLTFRGPDQSAPVDMYSDPISSQTVEGGVTSFGIRNGRQPSSTTPVRLRVVAKAKGYQTTSEVVEVHEVGNKQLTLDLLSTNPKEQPKGATGVRDESGTVRSGRMAAELAVETPAKGETGTAALHVPEGSALHTRKRSVDGNLTVDLSYYPPTKETLNALPGSGTISTGSETERFSVVGYMNLRIRDAEGQPVSKISGKAEQSTGPRTTARLPKGAVHPDTGAPLQAGDQLDLYRYDDEAGLWHSDTTVTVQSLADQKKGGISGTGSKAALGIQWNPWAKTPAQWWAWGARSQTSCEIDAQVQISPNGQAGGLQVSLHRPGLQYTGSVNVGALSTDGQSLTNLLDQSSVARHQDYSLTVTTRDGQTRTIEDVAPCGGTYAVTLPAPPPTPRTDVLFRAYPECPAGQKVRITAVPTVTVYYRESDAPSGAPWHTASDENISWIMDDPENPTYIKRTELRLDGLKQDTRYDLFTTYDGQRYEASGLVPSRSTAQIVEDRVLVEYSQDFSSVCS